MTDDSTIDTDGMTRAEQMAKLMEAYDVPIDLIRYDDTYTEQERDG